MEGLRLNFPKSGSDEKGSTSLLALLVLILVLAIGGLSFYDWDSDGLRNYQEWTGSTGWNNPDTDGDGLLDGEEVGQYGSNPVSVDSSGDGINDKKAVSLNLDPTEEYPLMNRAIENEFSKNVIQSLANLNNFDLNSKNTAFLEELSRLPEEERFPFSYFITGDGKIDLRNDHQIHYLLDLPQEKHSKYVEKELICDFNLDDDFGSNWFESNISKTNPFSSNERYALLVDSTHESREEVNGLHKKLKNIGLPENHIFELVGDEATYEGLASTLEEIGSIDRESDQLFINIQGHGGGGFSLKGGGIRYSELDGLLDEVDSTIVLTNESCYSGASLPSLSQDGRIIISQVKENQFAVGVPLIGEVLIGSFHIPEADANGNGYVSVGEAFDYGKEKIGPIYGENQTHYRDPQISNISLADNLYMTQHFVNS